MSPTIFSAQPMIFGGCAGGCAWPRIRWAHRAASPPERAAPDRTPRGRPQRYRMSHRHLLRTAALLALVACAIAPGVARAQAPPGYGEPAKPAARDTSRFLPN